MTTVYILIPSRLSCHVNVLESESRLYGGQEEEALGESG